MDLSGILRKLADLSGGRKVGSSRLRGEEVARLAKLLGVNVYRISELLGKDRNRLSKLVGDTLKMNAKVNLGGARSDGYRHTGERVSSSRRSGVSNAPRMKRVKGLTKRKGKKSG